jgi:hypothetical protein
MKRRGFLGFLSGGAIWPLVAAAQQTPKIPKIGYLPLLLSKDTTFELSDRSFENLAIRTVNTS